MEQHATMSDRADHVNKYQSIRTGPQYIRLCSFKQHVYTTPQLMPMSRVITRNRVHYVCISYTGSPLLAAVYVYDQREIALQSHAMVRDGISIVVEFIISHILLSPALLLCGTQGVRETDTLSACYIHYDDIFQTSWQTELPYSVAPRHNIHT